MSRHRSIVTHWIPEAIFRRRRLSSAIIFMVLALLLPERSGAVEIHSIQEIRRLTRQEAAKNLAVKVSGTCIYVANGEFFVHDGSHGIWVSSLTSKSRGLMRDASGLSGIGVGITVEVEGVTDPGGYARQILPSSVRQTGRAALPVPVRISAEQLVAGNEDGQWVELEGVVQDVQVLADRTVCSLMAKGVNCWISLHGDGGKNLPLLVDARVKAVGAFAPDFNNRSEAVLPKIISSAPDCIHVIQPPPDDPFESARVGFHDLRGFSPDVTLFHRKVTSGVVTFVRPGEFFFLRDGQTSVRVTSDAVEIQPGWRVDVAGFIDTSQHLAALKNGIVRKTGEQPPPPPETVTATDLLKSASWQAPPRLDSSDYSGRRITLRGLIRRVDRSAPLAPVAVWIEADDRLFPANLPPATLLDEQQSDRWQPGAEAEITGTCELDFRGRPDPLGLYEPVGFHVWLASAGDLKIIHPAPWWTTRRLAIALSCTGLAALSAMAGVAVLRRQVKRQVDIIARELETRAVSSERERMARDLHDTLEQHLTGVAMQLESLAKHPESHPPGFSKRLTLANRMIQHSREEARRSVWDLRNRVLETHGLPAALHSLAETVAIDGGPEVRTSITGSSLDIEPTIAYQLLRMAQEAVANALKHARADHIHIQLSMTADQYTLGIRDDGVGFDAQLANPPGPPHFGLIGMRERAARIGAVLEIASKPGCGTTVTITLPFPTS